MELVIEVWDRFKEALEPLHETGKLGIIRLRFQGGYFQ